MADILFDGDVAQGGYGDRFAGVVFPGETLKANVWKDDARYIAVWSHLRGTTPRCSPVWS